MHSKLHEEPSAKTLGDQNPSSRSRTGYFLGALFLLVAVIALCPFFFKDLKNSQGLFGSRLHPETQKSDIVLGTINGNSVSSSMLDTKGRQDLFRAQDSVYKEIQNLLAERYIQELVTAYQKDHKIANPQQAQMEFFAPHIQVPQEKVDQFLAENKGNPAFTGKTIDEQRTMVSQYLGQQASQQYIRSLIDQATKTGAISVAMAKPQQERVSVEAGDSPSLGPVNAPVTIVEFGDYQCPFCRTGFLTLQNVLKQFDGKVRFVYKQFPLYQIHPQAIPASVAAACAGLQNAYWPMHNALYENQANLSDTLYPTLAKQLNLNETDFQTCLKNPDMRNLVMKDQQYGSSIGVGSTPAFFINGVQLDGALPESEFARVIQEQLDAQGK